MVSDDIPPQLLELHQHFQVLYLLLLQLIDCGKVDVKDVALEIDLSPDSLSAALAVM